MISEKEILATLKKAGADFVHFVSISKLQETQNKGFPNAILFGKVFSRGYIKKITKMPNYVENMVQNNLVHKDEFASLEKEMDALADFLENAIKQKGFSAYSQSEKNIEETGFYDKKTNHTPLPHKTLALMAGMGWIGKHNLLVTPEFGSAVSMCSVLTDVPLSTVLDKPAKSRCGTCTVCIDICDVKALKGKTWIPGTLRDEMVDVSKCTTCLKCLIFCPWTQNYAEIRTPNFSREDKHT